MLYWHKDRKKEQFNRIERPKIHPFDLCQSGPITQWGKERNHKWHWFNWVPIWEKIES